MQYPIDITFKLVALASQLNVIDSTGKQLFYVKQKMFKLKERVEVYQDSTKANLLYTISANKVIDWSAVYTLADASGKELGTIKRKGAASIWKASYDITVGDTVLHVREANQWVKVLDALVSAIPIVGAFGGYFLNPKYLIADPSGKAYGMLHKQPAFFEGKFIIESDLLSSLDETKQQNVTALLMMAVLLERIRG